MKTKTRLQAMLYTLVFVLYGPAVQAIPFSINFSGERLTVVGEYINAVPVPIDQREFADLFAAGQRVSGSIAYDTAQPDVNPDPNTGTYRVGSLSVRIADLGLTASRSSNSMQISAFNDTSNPDDQFFAYVAGTDSFLNDVGLPDPSSFSVLLFGDTAMLADGQLPLSELDWNFGNLSFDFVASDNTLRQVLMTFVPAQIPTPATIWLLVLGLSLIKGGRVLFRCTPMKV